MLVVVALGGAQRLWGDCPTGLAEETATAWIPHEPAGTWDLCLVSDLYLPEAGPSLRWHRECLGARTLRTPSFLPSGLSVKLEMPA